jgi:putative ABC transport system ATP-binding protein
MDKYLVEVEELSKYYKDGSSKTIALDKVSFNIKEGESIAVVGPSGSGKTTLLEIMAGLNKPSSGKVTILGQNVHKGSDKKHLNSGTRL